MIFKSGSLLWQKSAQQEKTRKMKKVDYNNVKSGKFYLVYNKARTQEYIVETIKQSSLKYKDELATVKYFVSLHHKVVCENYNTKAGETHDFGFFKSDFIYEMDEKEMLARMI